MDRWKREVGAEINTFRIFSAETAEGKEAEYIDEKLPQERKQERKIVRFFRAFLISLAVLTTIYVLYMSR